MSDTNFGLISHSEVQTHVNTWNTHYSHLATGIDVFRIPKNPYLDFSHVSVASFCLISFPGSCYKSQESKQHYIIKYLFINLKIQNWNRIYIFLKQLLKIWTKLLFYQFLYLPKFTISNFQSVLIWLCKNILYLHLPNLSWIIHILW